MEDRREDEGRPLEPVRDVPHQDHDQKDHKHEPQAAARGITPTAAIAPARSCSRDHYDQEYQKQNTHRQFLHAVSYRIGPMYDAAGGGFRRSLRGNKSREIHRSRYSRASPISGHRQSLTS